MDSYRINTWKTTMGLVNGSATRLVYHQCNPQLANIPTIFSLYMLDKSIIICAAFTFDVNMYICLYKMYLHMCRCT